MTLTSVNLGQLMSPNVNYSVNNEYQQQLNPNQPLPRMGQPLLLDPLNIGGGIS